MSRSLRRALKPFAISGAALALLVALGQPLGQSNFPAPSARSLLSQLEQLPAAMALGSADAALAAMETCDASAVLADEARIREKAKLVKTALRMRWMITSFGGGSRSCSSPDCTG